MRKSPSVYLEESVDLSNSKGKNVLQSTTAHARFSHWVPICGAYAKILQQHSALFMKDWFSK